MDLDMSKVRNLGSQNYHPRRAVLADSGLYPLKTKEFRDGDVAERFHENTKRTERVKFDDFRINLFLDDPTVGFVESTMRPDYRGCELLDLPDPEDLDVSLTDAVDGRRSRRKFTGRGLSRAELSTLLRHSCGVTNRMAVMPPGENDRSAESSFRSYPSAGGLYPVETYLAVVNEGQDLTTGLYYYVPEKHGLRVLKNDTDDFASAMRDRFFEDQTVIDYEDSAVIVLLTAAFWRSKAKYGPTGYRFALQESGHVMQNFLLAAEGMGLAGTPVGGCKENEMNDFLGVNGVDEALTYVGCIGFPEGET